MSKFVTKTSYDLEEIKVNIGDEAIKEFFKNSQKSFQKTRTENSFVVKGTQHNIFKVLGVGFGTGFLNNTKVIWGYFNKQTLISFYPNDKNFSHKI